MTDTKTKPAAESKSDKPKAKPAPNLKLLRAREERLVKTLAEVRALIEEVETKQRDRKAKSLAAIQAAKEKILAKEAEALAAIQAGQDAADEQVEDETTEE